VEAAHGRYALAGAATRFAFSAFGTGFEARACACVTFDKWGDDDVLFHAFGGVEEGDVGLDFDVVADEDFFLEGVASSPAAAAAASLAGEGAEEVFEVYVLKAALETTCALGSSEAAKSAKASSCEWVAAWAAGSCSCAWVEAAICVECGGSVCIVCLLLLCVGENFVCGLGGGESVFCGGLFVCVGVVFLCEAVVCFLDVCGGSILVDAEGFVRVGYCVGRRGSVKVLVTMLACDYCRDMRIKHTRIEGACSGLRAVSDGLFTFGRVD
jgi:hypothetical protein